MLDEVTVAVGSSEGFFSVDDLAAALKKANSATWLLADGDAITVRAVEDDKFRAQKAFVKMLVDKGGTPRD